MKSVVLTGIRQAEVIDKDEPSIQSPSDVLLRVGAIGVCGSDVHYYVSGRIGTQVVEYPYTVGHEFGATVVDVGEAVTRVKPGDRIAVDPAMSCGRCDQCLGGRSHTCREILFLGCPGQVEGCMSEFIVMPDICCYPIPDNMTLAQAALCEPLAIGCYAVDLSIPMEGARIAVLGCGPIGLSVLLPAVAAGAEAVYVTDRIGRRVDVARGAGATWAGNPDHEDVVGKIASLEPMLLDVVFECCGQQDALDQAVELLKPGGKLMLVGIPAEDRVSFVMERLRRHELTIQNVRRQNGCVQAAIDSISGGEIGVDFMITHRFPLEEAAAALDLVDTYGDGVVKAMITL